MGVETDSDAEQYPGKNRTNAQSNLAKGRIVDFSLPAAANRFVRPRLPSNTGFLGPT